ncbi:protein RUFY3 isoform X2 [Hippocampus comes]|uniref:protein RUFY3 isoform X2 n=1 Tax=Hippocampus comes TaxID=109280 RepID=UPI00094EC1C4|nr:PREDICTED: protein RUFY3 isoform X2 [Hippocampus comes]
MTSTSRGWNPSGKKEEGGKRGEEAQRLHRSQGGGESDRATDTCSTHPFCPLTGNFGGASARPVRFCFFGYFYFFAESSSSPPPPAIMSDLTPQSETPTPTTDKITQAARETIYLCNFRVSVDGEWLCLRELNDISLTPDPESAHEDPKDPITIERLNLMNMAKLSIKGLIESALNLGRTLDSDYAPLQQFFVVMEHCLKHGLKTKKSFLGQNKSFWGALELVEKLTPEAGEITASVKDLPGLKTPLGRGRAWLRLALMQKKLSDYMKSIINRKDLLSEFYEPNALMMEEEGAVIAGLLVGLNVIDANLCMKGEDLDSQVGVIDFSMYLKDGGHSSKSAEGDGQITAILDQKNYVEELNRHLSASVNNLQAKVDALEKSNTKLTEELAVANNRIITLQEDVERVKEESSYQLESGRKALRSDSAASDGPALGETRRQLREETLLRLDVEKELEVQIGMKQEMELSMKMLEKDVCDKQDALAELRQQLDDLRVINQQLSHKSQSADASSKQKSDAVARLEDKISQMSGTVKQLESRCKQAEREKEAALEANRLFKREFGDKIEGLEVELERLRRRGSAPETELREERERRSADARPPDLPRPPSGSPAVTKDPRVAAEDKSGLDSSLSFRPSHDDDEQEEPSADVGEASVCGICEREDSLLETKRRCKNCGGAFCEGCVANELPLPSSILPEVVCAACYALLLQQYASTSPA